MSIAALKWVIDDAEAPTAHATLVLIIYANFANENGRAYPSTETVVKKTKQNVKTVRAAIDALELAGLLVDTGKRVGRTGNVKVYALGMEGLPEVGALPGEAAPDRATAPQEAPQARPAQARPKAVALKAPVSGSKGTRFREAEPVLEPFPLEDANASSSPRRGAKERCGTADQDWQAPAIGDLPTEARRVAEQWPAGAYAHLAAGHAAYCAGRGGRRRDPGRTWVARVIELGARPIRDARAGLRFDAAAAHATLAVMGDRADQLDSSAAVYERMGRSEEAVELRRQAAEVRAAR